MDVTSGLSAAIEHTVTETDTAASLGSGDLPVLATPRVVAWLEGAAVAAVIGHLDEGRTTVGSHITVDHLAPTAVGATVTAEAIVSAVEGRRIDFEVEASENGALIVRGRHTRHVVDRDRFLSHLEAER